jgi:hypothetical protein
VRSSASPRTISELEQHSSKGVCEAWPLAAPTKENSWLAVKLYIDEVGALRKRPRNARAEALVTATGQLGLAIHGDAFVGRLHLGAKFGEGTHAVARPPGDVARR